MPRTKTRAATSHSTASTGSRAASRASTDRSAPNRRAIHSSGVKRSAERSISICLARVVFPEQGRPQIRCSVAIVSPPMFSHNQHRSHQSPNARHQPSSAVHSKELCEIRFAASSTCIARRRCCCKNISILFILQIKAQSALLLPSRSLL